MALLGGMLLVIGAILGLAGLFTYIVSAWYKRRGRL